ncbi:hypothetical protein H9P43_010037 [Blastocladiella emersonii ATCC 22665]|nr:hypothetical protein H9P43_010037 [Blastocladiella emersonii ATCC 22665]
MKHRSLLLLALAAALAVVAVSVSASPVPASASAAIPKCTTQEGDTFLDALIKAPAARPPKYARALAAPAVADPKLQQALRALVTAATQRLVPEANATAATAGLVDRTTQFAFPTFGRCVLSSAALVAPWQSPVLEQYVLGLFESIAGPRAGTGLTLSPYDLWHAHLMVRRPCRDPALAGTTTVALVFHALEYPKLDADAFPYPLGFCQANSTVVYSPRAMAQRNAVWVASARTDASATTAAISPRLYLIDSDTRTGVASVDDTLGEAPFYTMDEARLGVPLGDVYYVPGTRVAVNLRTSG